MAVLRNFVNNQTSFFDFLQSCLKQHSMSKEISKISHLKMRLLNITGDRFIIPSFFSSLVVVPVYWLPGRGWLLLIQSSIVFEQSSCVCVFEQSRAEQCV